MDKQQEMAITALKLRSAPYLRADIALYDMLRLFETGRCHMAVLTQPLHKDGSHPAEVRGHLWLTDKALGCQEVFCPLAVLLACASGQMARPPCRGADEGTGLRLHAEHPQDCFEHVSCFQLFNGRSTVFAASGCNWALPRLRCSWQHSVWPASTCTWALSS